MPDKSKKSSSKSKKKPSRGARKPTNPKSAAPPTKPRRPKPALSTAPASASPRVAEPAAPVSTRPADDARRWNDRDAFPIVGIGASAGGLEALEKFFAQVPERSGVAFVVIQHLDPTHKGMLVELLQRGTPIKVVQAQEDTKVEKDHVYVIPPNKDMSLLHGKLHLLPQASPRGLKLPIDFFFRSLAEDQKDRGIGVILSGMGSDGTLGLRAIKEKAGAAFVQAIGSAKFDGMPRSAIDAGLADVVVPVEELPEKILTYCQRARTMTRSIDRTPEQKVESALGKVFVLLRTHTGNDFSLYKKSTIYRRIERRMGLHQIDNPTHYVRYLRENPREIDLLFKELLIGVTSFFREPAAWEVLRTEVIPALISARATGGILRAWVPGCSTGEEAYSLAIVFKEAMEPFTTVRGLGLQIFATDLDREAIDKARIGLYPDNIAADVSQERLKKYFVEEERGYRVGKDIRELVVFAPQNITMDPPFTKLDILSCRNLLIYLSSELQKKLIPLFHYSLNAGGVLFLGSAETIGSFSSLFAPLDTKTRLYRRLDQSVVAVPFEFPSTHPAQSEPEPEPVTSQKPPPNLQTLADRVLVQRFAPVGVLCNDNGDVLYISGRAGRYLEPAVGKANLNVFAMAREGLRYDLIRAFNQALRDDRVVNVRGVQIGTNGGAQAVDITAQRLVEPKELRGTVLVVISDTPPPHPTDSSPPTKGSARRRSDNPHIAELEAEIQRGREDVQTAREEMQTSQEELKSTNEELQSTNEELQSSNEELTTSKEEMQSLNEELQTVNHELQAKVDELSRSNNDMKNLLNSTDIATLFLDGDLHVRRFTTPITRVIKLIPADVGRSITDIATDLDYPDLADDARDVLRTLIFREKQVATRDKRWFSVRTMPYRTVDNVIDGVVITFTDMSASRMLEAATQKQVDHLRQLTESLPNLVFGCRANGSCDYLSPQWAAYTGFPEADQLGYGWIEQAHAEDRERVWEAWRAAMKAGSVFELDFRIRRADGEYRWFRSRATPVRDEKGVVQRWYGTHTDVDDIRRAGGPRAPALERVSLVLDGMGEGFIALNPDLVVTFFNAAAEGLLERKRRDVIGNALFDAFPRARDSALHAKLREAMLAGTAVTFDGPLDGGDGHGRRYRVRVQPHPEREGVSIFLEPSHDGVESA